MTIIGEQYLKNNSYSKIIINEKSIVFLEGSEQITMFDTELLEQLKKMDFQEQVSALIDHFIRTNSVGGIIYGHKAGGCDTNIIISEDNRALIIEGEISLKDYNKIYEAYSQNRLNALHNKVHKNYSVSSKFEGITSFHSEEDTLEFELTNNGIQIDLEERELLKELIETLFKDEEIIFDYIEGNENLTGWYIVSKDSDMKLKLNNLLYYSNVLTAIIYNHNCELESKKQKEMQLKMEEF